MRKLNISAEQRERLIASLPAEEYTLKQVQTESLRIFSELHLREGRPVYPRKGPAKGSGKQPQASARAKAVHAAEHEHNQEYYDTTNYYEDYPEDNGEPEDTVEEMVQRELEALATDLDEHEEGLDQGEVEAVEKAAVQL